MTDREKLVEIVCQAMQEVDCIEHFNHTPCYKVHHVVDELIAHGVTVKEMQKPIRRGHLLENSPCWFEVRYDDGHVELEPVEITKGTGANYYIYVIGSEAGTKLDGLEYGKWWRCWAERPTEEERKAAEWL